MALYLDTKQIQLNAPLSTVHFKRESKVRATYIWDELVVNLGKHCTFIFALFSVGLHLRQLTFTACSLPITSISGTSWYQGDKLRAKYTAKLAGSRTRRVAPMFSPSVITALQCPRTVVNFWASYSSMETRAQVTTFTTEARESHLSWCWFHILVSTQKREVAPLFYQQYSNSH